MKSEAELRREFEAAERRRKQEEVTRPQYTPPTPGGWSSPWQS